jgi:hypothetical protein
MEMEKDQMTNIQESDDVLSILLPKLHKQYQSTANRKDPRLSGQLNKGEITKYGVRIV